MNRAMLSFFRRLRRDQSGAVAMIVAVSIVALVGVSALVIDGGNVINAQRTLQASSSAAALAAAPDIGSATNPVTTATLYSSVAGSQNAHANLTGVTITTTLKCFTSTGVTCTGAPLANGIVVTQQATVSTFVGSVLGIGSVNISATATAGSKGGKSKFLDVMLVLDTTASMNTTDSGCSGITRLNCALTGVRALLSGLWPTVDQVGLMVFPGLSTASVSNDSDCASSTAPAVVAYNNSPVYQIIPLVTNYRTSNTAPLDPTSAIVRAAHGGGSGCQGIIAVGGVKTFYADAITAAQTALATHGRTGVQKVIILLGDGDANADSGNMPTSEKNNQCHEAIAAAQAAKTATPATWVYSIAYGASSSGCSTDNSPSISPCATMQQIASDSTKFFSSDTSCVSSQSITQLNQIFQNIGTDLTSGRLLRNDAT
jgi:Flp pilus assembly protein TadG